MAAKFGTSGLRGLVEEITDGTCDKYVRGYLRHLKNQNIAKEGSKVFIGYDLRASSPLICEQTIAAAIKENFIPINCADLPTPALALYAMHNHSASIMITGSHIPADRNGIKFYRPDGEIDKSDEQEIQKYAGEISEENIASDVDFDQVPNERAEAVEQFSERYKSLFSSSFFHGKRIGIYEHSSVARDILKDVFEAFGANVFSLDRSETFIPVDTEAVSDDTVKNLKAWTEEYQLDAILSTDGDGDRPLLSDENGNYIKGDILGLIASKYLNVDVIATPISSNSGIQNSPNTEVYLTRVGSPYVIAAINEALDKDSGRVVGFEANGGFLLASKSNMGHGTLQPLPTRDCVLPMLAVLAMSIDQNLPLSKLVTSYEMPITHAGRIQEFPTEISSTFVAELTNSTEKRDEFFAPFGSVQDINIIDGLRVTLDNGEIVHLRPSGNAPEMRCYVEAESIAAAEELVSKVVSAIKVYNSI
ncbi:MAG: phosphomannomutase [Rhizobiaceae bacterium]|nr:phosphomannomutase [Rhizobiaceae bacterium]